MESPWKDLSAWTVDIRDGHPWLIKLILENQYDAI